MFGDSVFHVYAPLDLPGAVRRSSSSASSPPADHHGNRDLAEPVPRAAARVPI
jgi:hypothetical protein